LRSGKRGGKLFIDVILMEGWEEEQKSGKKVRKSNPKQIEYL
jgi:hypothetical protein